MGAADATAFGLRRDHVLIEVLAICPDAARLLEVKRRYDPDNVFSSAIPLPFR